MKMEDLNKDYSLNVILDSIRRSTLNSKPLIEDGYGLVCLPNDFISKLNLITSAGVRSAEEVLETALDLYCEKYMR